MATGRLPKTCHRADIVRARKYCADFRSLLFLAILCSLVGSLPRPAFSAEESFSQKYQIYRSVISTATTAFNRKDYQTAAEQFSRAIEMSPFEAAHYYQRGIALFKMGKEDKAIEDFSKVITLDPKMGAAFTYRGLCRMKGGDNKGALEDYQRALSSNPKDASIHNNLAWLYATAKDEKLRDKVKALEHAVKAAELSNEKNPEILDTLARVYFINAKVKEAIETEKKALALESGNERFKESLREYEGAMKKD